MQESTAMLILGVLNTVQTMIKAYREPIVDSQGNVIAENLEAYGDMKSPDELFQAAYGEDRETVLARMEHLIQGGDET